MRGKVLSVFERCRTLGTLAMPPLPRQQLRCIGRKRSIGLQRRNGVVASVRLPAVVYARRQKTSANLQLISVVARWRKPCAAKTGDLQPPK